MPDAEESGAGLKGALDTAARLEEMGREAFIVQLPRPEGLEKVDAADFLRDQEAAEFKELVAGAKTPLQLEIDALAEERPSLQQLPGKLEPLIERIRLQSPTGREVSLQYLGGALNLD